MRFFLSPVPLAMAPPRRNPMFCIYFKRESSPFAYVHTYIRTTEKERYRCRHHAHPPLHSTPSISAPPKARFLGTTAERGRSAAAGRREEGGTRDREGDSLHHRSRHIVNNITGQPDQKSELGMECEDNKNFAFQLQQAEKSFRKGWS